MDIYENAEQLKKIPLLSGANESQLKLLAFCSEATVFDAGEYLFRLADTPDCVFVILEGEVDITWDKELDNPVNLATLGKNNLLGEMGVFLDKPRNSSVIAKDKVQTLRIPANRFLKLVTESPCVALEVMRQLSKKIAYASDVTIASKIELRRLRAKD